MQPSLVRSQPLASGTASAWLTAFSLILLMTISVKNARLRVLVSDCGAFGKFVDLESDNADIHVMDMVMLADVIRVCKRYEEEKEAGRRRTPDEKSAMIVRKALLKGALEMPLTALAQLGDYSFRPDACAIYWPQRPCLRSVTVAELRTGDCF